MLLSTSIPESSSSATLLSSFLQKPTSSSWSSSFSKLSISFDAIKAPSLSTHNTKSLIKAAAWTRRSRGEAAKSGNKKSWKQRTDMYMRPFVLDVYFSRRFIHAKVMHRGTSKVVSAASTNCKDLRYSLPSPSDDNACRIIGNLIAERCKEADVFAMSYDPPSMERIQDKVGIVIDTIKENGIIFV
ncbi:50S ribosomal protein L18-like [Cucumis melo var. makuwa]|uniref:50S ribosomal protein L18-like n=1 Tax=Cucumis melo var. makuwa TaxID=1194695 RepID=A0A5A7U4A4_CUCMM|nr:50S ribosomal protein L18-like [Cucumis melo var. makuwa]TYK17467.1 50S ribosomal protein L18-like [Cucumis melo var. makuwa]